MKPINPDINLQNNIQCNRVLESRDFYKGKSFHYAGPWTVGTTYHSDSYIQDFVSFGGALLVCTQTHLSDQSNMPILNYSDSEEKLPTSLQSNRYWSFVIGAVKGDKGEKGETGKQGTPGKDGVGITSIDDAIGDDYTTVTIQLSDGHTNVIDIPNGKAGANGIDGKDGDTIESITRVDGTNKFNFNFHTAEHETKSIELDLTDVLEQWKNDVEINKLVRGEIHIYKQFEYGDGLNSFGAMPENIYELTISKHDIKWNPDSKKLFYYESENWKELTLDEGWRYNCPMFFKGPIWDFTFVFWGKLDGKEYVINRSPGNPDTYNEEHYFKGSGGKMIHFPPLFSSEDIDVTFENARFNLSINDNYINKISSIDGGEITFENNG